MTPEAIAQIFQVGGTLAGLLMLIRFMSEVISYQRGEKERCHQDYKDLVSRLLADPDIDNSKVAQLVNGAKIPH